MKRVLQSIVLIVTIFICYWISLPLIGEIYLSIGNAYLEKKYLYVAMDYYQKGIYFYRFNPKLYNNLGLLYLDIARMNGLSSKDMKFVELGLSTIEKAIPMTGDVYPDYSLGLAYELKGDMISAKHYFERAYARSAGKIGADKIKVK